MHIPAFRPPFQTISLFLIRSRIVLPCSDLDEGNLSSSLSPLNSLALSCEHLFLSLRVLLYSNLLFVSIKYYIHCISNIQILMLANLRVKQFRGIILKRLVLFFGLTRFTSTEPSKTAPVAFSWASVVLLVESGRMHFTRSDLVPDRISPTFAKRGDVSKSHD